MKVDLSSLDINILKQLPLSLQLEKSIVELSDLPNGVQQLIISNNIKETSTEIYRPVNIIDITFNRSKYNDVEILETKRKAIIEYIKNYLQTMRGSYPFDPEFGSELKKYLQVKNSTLQQSLLDAELKKFIDVINDSFRENVRIISTSIVPVNMLDHIEYNLSIRFSINEDEIIIELK
jgi:hypothetical protein